MYEWEIILILIFFFGTDKKAYTIVYVLSNTDLLWILRCEDTMRQFSPTPIKSFYRSSLIFRFIYTGVMTPWPSWPRFDTYHLSVHCNTAFVSSFPLFIKEREKVLRNCSKLNHVQKAEKNICFHKKKKKIIFVFIRHKSNLSTAW